MFERISTLKKNYNGISLQEFITSFILLRDR